MNKNLLLNISLLTWAISCSKTPPADVTAYQKLKDDYCQMINGSLQCLGKKINHDMKTNLKIIEGDNHPVQIQANK